MMEKEIPGYCTHVKKLAMKFDIDFQELKLATNKREVMKGKIRVYQRNLLIKEMMLGSKTDNILLHFNYEGKMKMYMRELSFQEARCIFMFRARMFPTRVNFPNRWSKSMNCVYCNNLDTDEHLLNCSGYIDITADSNISFNMFFELMDSMERLSFGAKILLKILHRLQLVAEDVEMTRNDDSLAPS